VIASALLVVQWSTNDAFAGDRGSQPKINAIIRAIIGITLPNLLELSDHRRSARPHRGAG
jgi:hypothetical protein